MLSRATAFLLLSLTLFHAASVSAAVPIPPLKLNALDLSLEATWQKFPEIVREAIRESKKDHPSLFELRDEHINAPLTELLTELLGEDEVGSKESQALLAGWKKSVQEQFDKIDFEKFIEETYVKRFSELLGKKPEESIRVLPLREIVLEGREVGVEISNFFSTTWKDSSFPGVTVVVVKGSSEPWVTRSFTWFGAEFGAVHRINVNVELEGISLPVSISVVASGLGEVEAYVKCRLEEFGLLIAIREEFFDPSSNSQLLELALVQEITKQWRESTRPYYASPTYQRLEYGLSMFGISEDEATLIRVFSTDFEEYKKVSTSYRELLDIAVNDPKAEEKNKEAAAKKFEDSYRDTVFVPHSRDMLRRWGSQSLTDKIWSGAQYFRKKQVDLAGFLDLSREFSEMSYRLRNVDLSGKISDHEVPLFVREMSRFYKKDEPVERQWSVIWNMLRVASVEEDYLAGLVVRFYQLSGFKNIENIMKLKTALRGVEWDSSELKRREQALEAVKSITGRKKAPKKLFPWSKPKRK